MVPVQPLAVVGGTTKEPQFSTAARRFRCALEVLVHSDGLPQDRMVIAAAIPDDVSIEMIADADLPADWKADIHPSSTRNYGTQWAAQKRSAVLSVPSAVVSDERNYLINPAHPNFAKIKFSNPKPFEFDLRLK